MSIRQVPVRHRTTGQEGVLPETALPHFPDWGRIDADLSEPTTERDATADPPAATSKTARKGRTSPAAEDTKE